MLNHICILFTVQFSIINQTALLIKMTILHACHKTQHVEILTALIYTLKFNFCFIELAHCQNLSSTRNVKLLLG